MRGFNVGYSEVMEGSVQDFEYEVLLSGVIGFGGFILDFVFKMKSRHLDFRD